MDAIDRFVLQEWQIWRQYTTYLLDRLPSKDEIAARLVESGVVTCSRSAGGKLYWRRDGQLLMAEPRIDVQPDGTGTWMLPFQGEVDPFVLQCLHQSAWFETAETKVLVAPSQFPVPYVLGFVGECILEGGGRLFRAYPAVKLYENGVLQVLLRMFSPDQDIGLTVFIREYCAAQMHSFDTVLAPAGLVKALMQKEIDNPQRLPKAGSLRRRRLKEEFACLIDEQTRRTEDGDFAFDLGPLFVKGVTATLSPSGRAAFLPTTAHEQGYTLTELAETIVATVSYALGKRRRLTCRRIPLRQGNFWMGRPHVYISRHQDQRKTASENEKAHGPALGCILAGVLADSEEQALGFLPQSSRTFEDYGMYVTKAATLVVWSGKGLSRLAPFGDANRGHLIYEQHAVAQAMDYGYMMHRRALEFALTTETTTQAFEAQQDLIRLKRVLQDASPFGEIQELLQAGWQRMGINHLLDLISEAHQVRSQQAAKRETTKRGRWRFLVTAILGVLATSGISDQVISPAWQWRSWPLPSNQHLAGLLMWVVSLAIVVLILFLAWVFQATRGRLK